NTSFNLKPSTKPSGTLKVLRGSIPVEVMASRQPLLTIKNLMDVKGKLVKGEGDLVLAILQVQDQGGNGRQGNIRFVMTGVDRQFDPNRGGYNDQEMFRQRFEITDDQGRRHQINLNLNYSGGPGQEKMLEGNFFFSAPQDVGPATR